MPPRRRRAPFPRLLAPLALAVLAGCAATAPVPEAAPPSAPGHLRIEGKVSLGGVGAEGAQVLLFAPHFHLAPEGRPQARVTSGPDGAFRLEAPPGSYLLLARRGELFSYFGRNPVRLAGPLTGVHLPLVPTHAVKRTACGPGGERLEGRVLDGGEPVAGAQVFVYLDAAKGFRGPGYALSEPTGRDGAYAVPLPPGTYFAGARLRAGGPKTGTLEPGDRFGVLPEFPLLLREGECVRADIETVEVPGRDQQSRFQGRFARLEGRILDADGRPVPGVRACLYETPHLLDRPAVVSEPTGPDGRFVLETPLSGLLYLGAREALGAPPVPGERVGFYRGPRGPALEVVPGGRLGDLTVVLQVTP